MPSRIGSVPSPPTKIAPSVIPNTSGVNIRAVAPSLCRSGHSVGATGVIGIDFDYEVLGETNGMMMVAVSGTAVKVG